MSRLERFRDWIRQKGLDGFLITHVANVRYLSGFSSEDPHVAFLLISQKEAMLITDYRYEEQARTECTSFTVLKRDRQNEDLAPCLGRHMRRLDLVKIGFERDHILYNLINDLQEANPALKLEPCISAVEHFRKVKDPHEIECVRKAASIGDRAFENLLQQLKPGLTEREAAFILENEMIRMGSEGLSFPTIFLSGSRSSLPHGMPSHKPLEFGDLVCMDFGAVIGGYRSDMTRTIVLGEATSQQKEVFETVQEAQQAGIEVLRPEIACWEPFKASDRILKNSPFRDFCGEGLGHCVGLVLHERPYLEEGNDEVLQAGMILTVEPGIYIPNWGGVRIEDDFLITEEGYEKLTHAPSDLRVVPWD